MPVAAKKTLPTYGPLARRTGWPLSSVWLACFRKASNPARPALLMPRLTALDAPNAAPGVSRNAVISSAARLGSIADSIVSRRGRP